MSTWTNGRVHYRYAGDVRRNRAHYDVTVIVLAISFKVAPLSLGQPHSYEMTIKTTLKYIGDINELELELETWTWKKFIRQYTVLHISTTAVSQDY